jgi:hypothetical protein
MILYEEKSTGREGSERGEDQLQNEELSISDALAQMINERILKTTL